MDGLVASIAKNDGPIIMTAVPLLSISIVNYNACGRLRECLTSLVTNVSIPDLEIIVVDNASHDGSPEMISAEFPHVSLIENTINHGFNRANNQGLARATGRYLLSLNNDTVVPPGSLEKLVDFLENHSEYGAIGGKLISANGNFQWQSRRSFPTPFVALSYMLQLRRFFPQVTLFHQYTLTNHDPTESLEVDSVSGACLLVRREVYTQTGGMDNIYFMYGDDLDWCFRIKRLGWKIRYCAEAPILHYGGEGGTHHTSYALIYHYYRAMWLFYSRNLRSRYFILTTACVWVGIWLAMAAHALLYFLGIYRVVSRKKLGSRFSGSPFTISRSSFSFYYYQ